MSPPRRPRCPGLSKWSHLSPWRKAGLHLAALPGQAAPPEGGEAVGEAAEDRLILASLSICCLFLPFTTQAVFRETETFTALLKNVLVVFLVRASCDYSNRVRHVNTRLPFLSSRTVIQQAKWSWIYRLVPMLPVRD